VFEVVISYMDSFISPQVLIQTNYLELIVQNDVSALQQALQARPYIINQLIINGDETLLNRACIEKKKKVIKFLLRQGADPNIQCAKFQNETGQ
jgi:ankyrin repeat protein